MAASRRCSSPSTASRATICRGMRKPSELSTSASAMATPGATAIPCHCFMVILQTSQHTRIVGEGESPLSGGGAHDCGKEGGCLEKAGLGPPYAENVTALDSDD